MATKQGGTFFSVIFTTIVAPITVSLAVKKLDEEVKPAQTATETSKPTVAPHPTYISKTAEGVGRSPEEALQQALSLALHDILSTTVPQNLAHRQYVIDTLMRDNQGLIVDYQNVRSFDSWKRWQKVSHRVVTCRVSRTILDERIKTLTGQSKGVLASCAMIP